MRSKNSKMLNILNYRLRITLSDTRVLIGQMMAFDNHMNLVLADCDEIRTIKKKDEESEEVIGTDYKRRLGLVILRGETILTLSIEGPPPQSYLDARRTRSLAAGAGMGRPAGRGMPPGAPMAMPGFAGPGRGMGPPPPGMMPPPMPYGRPPMPPPGGFRPPPGGFGPGVPPPPMGFRPPLGAPGTPPPPGVRPGMHPPPPPGMSRPPPPPPPQ